MQAVQSLLRMLGLLTQLQQDTKGNIMDIFLLVWPEI